MKGNTEAHENVSLNQGCQMAYFQTKNPNCGIFWEAFEWKILLYFMDIWYFESCLLNCIAVWYILCSFGIFLTILVCCTKKNLATLVLIKREVSNVDFLLFLSRKVDRSQM
jgi:hypothetical protein